MKICFKCGKTKSLEDFYKHPQMSDGHVNKCKECNKLDVHKNYADKSDYYSEYDKNRQRRSKARIFNHRYNQIRQRVEGRSTRVYSVKGKGMLSYEEYAMWLKSNIDRFDGLYEAWVASGYSRKLTPSIDRIDSNESYVASNMQWMTVSDNSKKSTR